MSSSITYVEAVLDSEAAMASARFRSYAFAQPQMQHAYYAAVQQDRYYGFSGEGEYQIYPESVIILKPVCFTEHEAEPDDGAWLLRYTAQREGDTKVYNLIFIKNSGEEMRQSVYYPGSTLADTTLVSDALHAAYAAAVQAVGGTSDSGLGVYDMEVLANPVVSGNWVERWSIIVDRQLVPVIMTFLISPAGGVNYSASIEQSA